MHCTLLHCTALHCTVLQYIALHCTALHCNFLFSESEEADTRDFTVRETERLKFITGRGSEDKKEEREKEREDEVEEDGGEEVEKKEILPPSLILYNKYKVLEEEVLAKVGMTKKDKEDLAKRQALGANLKNLLKV